MISLIQLQYVVAVDTYRHFVTAAEKCFVTQPTLSMQIKKLEDHLGVVIFDRSKQPIVPTTVGKKIIKKAREIIAEKDKLYEILQDYEENISGELHIGVIPSIAPYLMPKFIGNFSSTYPEVKITITELLSEEIVDQLKKDLIDVGILVTPLKENGIDEHPLFYEKMMLYVNKSHQLSKENNIDTSSLASPELWMLGKGHCFRSQVVNLCSYQESHEHEHQIAYESGSIETLKRMVENEGGFTIIPEMAAEGIDGSKVAIKEIIDTNPLREVSLVSSRTHAKKKLIELLGEEIRSTVDPSWLSIDRGQIVDWK